MISLFEDSSAVKTLRLSGARLGVFLIHNVDGNGGARGDGARSHFGRNRDGFHDLLAGRALQPGAFRIAADAIRALRHVRDGDHDQFLGFGRQHAICKTC